MNREEQTKPFMMISNWKKTTFGLHGLYKNISGLQALKKPRMHVLILYEILKTPNLPEAIMLTNILFFLLLVCH